MRLRALLLLTCLSVSSFAQKKPATVAKPDPSAAREKAIAAMAEEMKPRLVEQRRDFYTHPELSNREERTSRVVAERLKAIGFTDVRTGVGKHGVVATLKGGKPGPVVAVRADMDGLPIQDVIDKPYRSPVPNVKQACGHDVHTTVELGVAEILYKMRDQLPGTVKFIFQPAEEGPPVGEEGGAPLMIKEGALENPKPEAIFGLHTHTEEDAGGINYTSGSMMASSDSFTIKIRGKQSHGAYPYKGIDSVVVAAQVVNALQTIVSRRMRALDPVVVTVGKINGGLRHNIVAPEVTLEGTVRTLNNDVRERVPVLMREILDGVTKANEATYELSFQKPGNFVTYNDPKLVEETLPVMRRILGADKVKAVDPEMGAEDFSWYQKQIPGFYWYLGTGNKAKGITAGVHTAEFDVDEDSLVVGVKLMSSVLFDYLDRHAK